MTEAQTEALKQKLEKLSGKKISLSLKTNPSLLGGGVELEGKELDGTVKGRLDGLSRKLGQPDTVIGCSDSKMKIQANKFA